MSTTTLPHTKAQLGKQANGWHSSALPIPASLPTLIMLHPGQPRSKPAIISLLPLLVTRLATCVLLWGTNLTPEGIA